MANSVWNAVKQRLRLRRLVEQYAERRHVGIPFDQGRDPPKPRQCLREKCPDLGADAGSVIVDPKTAAAFKIFDRMTGEMDLLDRSGVQRREVGRRLPAVINGADADVVDIAQHAAASFLRDSG